MRCSLKINNNLYHYDSSSFIDLSIPLNFDGTQPNFFGVEKATAVPYKSGNLIGATKQGGGCNFDVLTLIPHCNGTHTECVGHIVNDNISVHSIITDVLIPVTLITVQPRDGIIHEGQIAVESGFNAGLILRSLPNNESKCSRTYDSDHLPPYFSEEAMNKINVLSVNHLLVDMPTIDSAYDEGRLVNHHIFWGVDQDKHDLDGNPPSSKTITEMIYVPNDVPDDRYLLQIQVANFVSDAAPSRPVIFPIEM